MFLIAVIVTLTLKRFLICKQMLHKYLKMTGYLTRARKCIEPSYQCDGITVLEYLEITLQKCFNFDEMHILH